MIIFASSSSFSPFSFPDRRGLARDHCRFSINRRSQQLRRCCQPQSRSAGPASHILLIFSASIFQPSSFYLIVSSCRSPIYSAIHPLTHSQTSASSSSPVNFFPTPYYLLIHHSKPVSPHRQSSYYTHSIRYLPHFTGLHV